MGSVNKAILLGRLGKDAELRVTPGGRAVATFSMATDEKWTDRNGEKQERTEWHRIVLWGKVAEALARYLTKGKQIYLEGRIQTRKYEKDSIVRYSTEVIADQIVLLGGGDRGGDRSGNFDPMTGYDNQTYRDDADRHGQHAGGAVTDDDIPF